MNGPKGVPELYIYSVSIQLHSLPNEKHKISKKSLSENIRKQTFYTNVDSFLT